MLLLFFATDGWAVDPPADVPRTVGCGITLRLAFNDELDRPSVRRNIVGRLLVDLIPRYDGALQYCRHVAGPATPYMFSVYVQEPYSSLPLYYNDQGPPEAFRACMNDQLYEMAWPTDGVAEYLATFNVDPAAECPVVYADVEA